MQPQVSRIHQHDAYRAVSVFTRDRFMPPIVSVIHPLFKIIYGVCHQCQWRTGSLYYPRSRTTAMVPERKTSVMKHFKPKLETRAATKEA